MNVSDLFKFFGHASVYEPFDDFLLTLGVKKRPKDSDDYPYILKLKDAGVSLGFEDDPADLGIERKSDGTFVFAKVHLDLTKKGGFSGDLPFGVGKARTKSEIVAILGKPLSEGDKPIGDGVGMTYFVDGLVYVFVWADRAATQLEYVSLALPNDADRQHGHAPDSAH
ncbi:hypothetical protein [Roseateles depolymerans]|uniref:Uncharacterized protein n=1 Tax=Roseateles depolymerans TaxID=76731 RepID=A0A0U3MMR5_9BURK|nr:hypothetical protein [Roseateles depolymerans]ALV08764.1 hypothetical protein RD2015_4321 [Roseateles depolymerans]REG21006.1 hypothetical protein DES44_0115 [Roseateles depolymerans]